MTDEVKEAQQRRWLRQLAEAFREVVKAEVPPPERASVLADLGNYFLDASLEEPGPEQPT